jgi:hypothetical protein
MTEIKDVLGMIFVVKAQLDTKRVHACPVAGRNEKEWLVPGKSSSQMRFDLGMLL